MDGSVVDAGGDDAGATDGGLDDAGAPDAGLDAGNPKLGPPYPIVLAHGFFGFDDFAGAGFLFYFYEVSERLAAEGETLVFTPEVDPFNGSDVRGAQLIVHIEDILSQTGHEKVNIIGHSQGGLDARVVAHDRPDLVASVTTVGTPHGGTVLADVVLDLISDGRAADLIDALVRLIGIPLFDATGNESSAMAALWLFSEPGIAAFNAEYTDSPQVAYYSLTGRTDLHPGGIECDAPAAPDFVTDWNLTLDPVDLLLDLSEQIVDGGLGSAIPNDGLVRVDDAKWGTFLGCVPADHLDEVGQILGDRPGLLNRWDHRDFYADLVAYLRVAGF